MTAIGLLAAAAALLGERVDEERLVGPDGGLQLQRCDACGYRRYPPGRRCPECLAEVTTWESDTGLGTVWSYCIYHRAFDPAFSAALPYNVSLVELDSGPRLVSNVLDVGAEDLLVGMRVVAVTREIAPGRSLVYFVLAAEKDGT